MKDLRKDKDLVVLAADKGNATVVMATRTYVNKMEELLANPAYRKVRRHSTGGVECRVGKLLKASGWSKEVHKSIGLYGSRPPRMYGLSKIHKVGVPLRPIVSRKGTSTYNLTKYSVGLLDPWAGQCDHYIKNSTAFVKIVDSLLCVGEWNDILVSFDVVSLFARVPLQEMLELLKPLFPGSITLFH